MIVMTTALSLGCAGTTGTGKLKYPVFPYPEFPYEIKWGTETNEIGEKFWILTDEDYKKLKEWAQTADRNLWKYHCAFREINGRPCPKPD